MSKTAVIGDGGEDQPPRKKMKTVEGVILTAGAEKDQAPRGVEDGHTAEGKEGGGGAEDIAGKEDGEDKDKEEPPNLYLSTLKEEDVGITQYISDHKGFSAIIKQRYSDFIVNEVSTSGEVVHLTNTDVPRIQEEVQVEPEGPVDEVLSAEFVTQLKEMAADPSQGTTVSMPAGDDKMHRMRIHRAIKTAFPNMETQTEEKEGVKVITAVIKGKEKGKRREAEWQWPASCRDQRYCRFTLYKENRTTMSMVSWMAKSLRVKDSLFSFAGTKDKRAKTTQQVTAFKLHPRKIANLNKFTNHATLGNFSFSDKNLRLGDLKGNRFTIVLRNVLGEEEAIEAGLVSLKERGFINYYGLQRFGTFHSATHLIGRAILQEKWEEAVDLILLGQGDEGLTHRKTWRDTKDARAALKALTYQQHIERNLLHHLAKKPTDFLGALQSLMRSTRLLYPHSYQSVVWNTVVSRRVAAFGLKPMVGDLVLPQDSVDTRVVGDNPELTAEDTTTKEEDQTTEKKDTTPPKVTPIVLDETTVSKYSIYDVVLPLPGFDIIYPNNEVHSWYKEMLEKDGLDIENMRRKQKDFSLPGGYRRIVMQPADMEWKMFRYDDPTASLSLSDIDRMNGVQEPESIPEGQQKAVRLALTLSLSGYATMALRELLKTDTSPAHQAAMNTPSTTEPDV